MKKLNCKFTLLCIVAAFAIISVSCEKSETEMAYLTFSLSDDYSYPSMNSIFTIPSGNTRVSLSLPDTNDFILSVISSDGKTVYEGHYGERPRVIKVPSGTYDVSLVSVDFSEPQFDMPQFGDSQSVVLSSNETLAVSFRCTQLNAGIRLLFESSFKDRFPSGDILLKMDKSSLKYPYNERRMAFFLPGTLKLVYLNSGIEENLLTRHLAAADMFTLKLSASAEDVNNFKIVIDTVRNWYSEDYMIGSGKDGSSVEKALEVPDLQSYIGAKDVWVVGYIVGGDMSSSKVKLEPPFSKNAHIAIAAKSVVHGREECAAVELSSTGPARDALNLVTNPGNLGRKVFIKGTVEEYYGYPGVKSLKDFKLE